jgi:hypothetical protein
MVFQPKEIIMTEAVWEQSSEENIWSCKTGSDRKMEKVKSIWVPQNDFSFRCEVDEKCILLGYYAASSGNS